MKPKSGDKIYVPDSYFSDYHGGIATIDRIQDEDDGTGNMEYNITLMENPYVGYDFTELNKQQTYLKNKFGSIKYGKNNESKIHSV